jgi:hypothetical protein
MGDLRSPPAVIYMNIVERYWGIGMAGLGPFHLIAPIAIYYASF